MKYVQVTEEQFTHGVVASGLSEVFAKQFTDMWLAIAFNYCECRHVNP